MSPTRAMLTDEADFVIIGTGAGGATAARVLSGAGHSIVMLEEGPELRTAERPRALLPSLAEAMRSGGTTATTGHAPISLLQGCCVGGSTAVNSGIIWRMPDDVRDEWHERHGLRALVDDAAMTRIYERIENELEITETGDAIRGRNASLMEQAAYSFGLQGRAMFRNAARCEGRAQCLQGCPGEARQSMDVSYVRVAQRASARLHHLARARRVSIRHGRATGVEGHLLDRSTRKVKGKFRIHARRGVIVAAGAVQTPLVLFRSGLRRLVGERFQAHPGLAVVGRFRDPVRMAFGATQGYEIPLRARGFKLESLSLPPEMLAARLPSAGAEWQEKLAQLDHFAQWAALVRMRARGRVRGSFLGEAVVRYEPTPADLEILRDAAMLVCRMMFAVGATEVYPGIAGVDEVLVDPRQVERIQHMPLTPASFHLVASHLFGTACAGNDAKQSVVAPSLETHDVRSLYVMDASVFPTNMGVNPQHTIMALAWRAAEWLS